MTTSFLKITPVWSWEAKQTNGIWWVKMLSINVFFANKSPHVVWCKTTGPDVKCVFLLSSSAADDPSHHVGSLRLGSIQQRHHCDLLVRNTIQGDLVADHTNSYSSPHLFSFLTRGLSNAHDFLHVTGILSPVGHPVLQLHHRRLVCSLFYHFTINVNIFKGTIQPK